MFNVGILNAWFSGTVWTQRIITLIYQEDFPDKAKQSTYEQMPWLEYRFKGKDYNTRPSPRLFCSHLLQPVMPKALQRKGKVCVHQSINTHYCRHAQFLIHLFDVRSSTSWETLKTSWCHISIFPTTWTTWILLRAWARCWKNSSQDAVRAKTI